VQLGFVIDQSRCIGCHACTVACKSENDVPVGSFRTWVKYTEEGQFPSVKRSFAVLRCNQCSDAPCMTICPVNALDKLDNGIVDVDPKACIGCKSCMHGCPYDALYIGDDGTAEKCNFCAHRADVGLAPACTVVCPTEALIPGDFDDPNSIVSKMRDSLDLTQRKTEAGTSPNVYYRDATAACLDPGLTSSAGGSLWADRNPKIDRAVQDFEAMEERATAKTSYNVEHAPLWGNKITGYLITKSIAAGLMLAVGAAGLLTNGSGVAGGGSMLQGLALPVLAMVFLGLTSLLLVTDLKRIDRFYYILTRPNWSSWLVRGTYALMSYGALLAVWCGLAIFDVQVGSGVRWGLYALTVISGGLAACYTGWLFGQAKGRVLWMRRGLWLHLIVQALAAGAACALLLAQLGLDFGAEGVLRLEWSLVGWLLLHLKLTLTEGFFAPKNREIEFERAHRLVSKGPFAKRHWIQGVLLGIVAPIILLALPLPPIVGLLAAGLVMNGLYTEEDILVRAGQALSIS